MKNIFRRFGYYTKEEFELEISKQEKNFMEGTKAWQVQIEKLTIIVEKLRQENEDLKIELKKVVSAKGGLVKQINKQKKQIEELDAKLKESMTDKYLVKKIPAGRTPKQTRSFKSSGVQSKIVKNMHEN